MIEHEDKTRRAAVAPPGAGTRTELGKPPVGAPSAAARPSAVDLPAHDTPPVEETTVPTQFPGFRILGKLGEGSFGAVYKAHDETLGRVVALKALLLRQDLTPAARDEFLAEARAMAALRHPNVLTIHSVLEHEGRIGLVTELIDGANLESGLKRQGPLGAGEAAEVGAQVCRALAAVHQKGMVHRDVKTANILRERGGRIVLGDFGLGVFISSASRVSMAGTPLYMAPEQVSGQPIDARTDLFALGVVLYRLVTGAYPYRGDSVEAIMAEKERNAVVPLRDARPDLPAEFVAVVEKAMSLNPAARFQSAGEMERALLQVEESAPRKAPQSPRRRALLIAASGGLAATLLLGAWWQWPREVRILEASLDRLVEKVWAPVQPGGAVSVGDNLSLRLRLDRTAHVYVLNEDLHARQSLLFPARGLALQNPLPAGALHRLPGADANGQTQAWPVASSGGVETFLIAVSTEPLEGIPELETAKPQAQKVAARTLRKTLLRGVEGLRPVQVESITDGDSPLAAVFAQLDSVDQGETTRAGLWVRRITVRNP